jgi:hypothetical protein
VRSRNASPAVLVAISLLALAACSAGPIASPAASPAQVVVPSYGPAFKVSGNRATGSSNALALDGSYLVQWSATPDKPSCTFHLLLADSAGGPPTDLGQTIIPGKATVTGSATMVVSSGRYFIRADRSAPTDCKGAWTAMISPEVAGPS